MAFEEEPKPVPMSEEEAEAVEESHTLSTPLIYEVVRQEGEEELARPFFSLWWSGLAAGLSMSFSVLASAAIAVHLPDTEWSPLVSKFGYCFGFVIIIMSRQQLFTENTIKVVLPVAHKPTADKFANVFRLWSIVLIANMCGAVLAAMFCSFPEVLADDILTEMLRLSREAMDKPWMAMALNGISAGFIMAALVWMLPNADSARFLVIVLMTYLIALGDFAHIVAGSVEGFLLVVNGELGIAAMLVSFVVPALIGNIIGGTALFTMIAYAQVHEEI